MFDVSLLEYRCNNFMLLLFRWPPTCAVSPSYEVVLFQPQSGAYLRLVFVPNLTSYLTPVPPFNCLLDISLSPSVSLPPYFSQQQYCTT